MCGKQNPQTAKVNRAQKSQTHTHTHTHTHTPTNYCNLRRLGLINVAIPLGPQNPGTPASPGSPFFPGGRGPSRKLK